MSASLHLYGTRPNSGAAQFFIDVGYGTNYSARVHETFGRVEQGMDVVERITPADTIQTVTSLTTGA